MPRSQPARRRRIAALGVLACAIAFAVLGSPLVQAQSTTPAATGATGATGPSALVDDPNNYSCFGHIAAGTAEQGVPGTQVEYEFYCDGPITGYAIETEPHQIEYFDQAPLVSLAGVPQSADGFSCNGDIPSVQVNCVGSTSVGSELITGQFVIAGNLCAEPRVDPILTVTEATATTTIGGTKSAPTATATVTQDMSGPYDLGRPWGCKGDGFGRDTRLGTTPPTVVLAPAPKKA